MSPQNICFALSALSVASACVGWWRSRERKHRRNRRRWRPAPIFLAAPRVKW